MHNLITFVSENGKKSLKSTIFLFFKILKKNSPSSEISFETKETEKRWDSLSLQPKVI